MLLVYKKKAIGAYLLSKPSGVVTGMGDAQAAMAAMEDTTVVAIPEGAAQQTSGEPGVYAEESTALYTDLPLDSEGYPVE